ncbi:hypothetical protein KC19_2G017700 [Ceratodon purpureus]|uniref:Uncharacterized protein n=1 Tax=Ceratodon purpureus TaxID=3225 RepID=A0A8T0IRU2_CERPU|nr:hypothetical protein KC19_2G017700 [Ceratodon purpureus]
MIQHFVLVPTNAANLLLLKSSLLFPPLTVAPSLAPAAPSKVKTTQPSLGNNTNRNCSLKHTSDQEIGHTHNNACALSSENPKQLTPQVPEPQKQSPEKITPQTPAVTGTNHGLIKPLKPNNPATSTHLIVDPGSGTLHTTSPPLFPPIIPTQSLSALKLAQPTSPKRAPSSHP